MNEDNRLSENEFQEAPQPSPEKPKRAKRVVQLTWGKLTAIIACCLVLSIGCGSEVPI